MSNYGITPSVEIVSHSQIVDMSGIQARGLYDWDQGKIYISSQVDLTTIHGMSVVLHEMVHHYQSTEGLFASYDCRNASELLAYETQKQFLTAMKASMMIEMDPLFIGAASTCHSDTHKRLVKAE